MVVCSYFLKGQCRFGDRCKYEHPGPKPFSGFGGGTGFGRSSNTTNKNVCQYFVKGECRFGANCKFLHPQNAGSGQNVFGSQSSFGGQSGQSGFGQNKFSSSFGGGNRNTGFNRNQNRFSALSNDATSRGSTAVFGGGQQQQSTTASILSNPTQVTQMQQIVRRDMETWETSNQWPLSCYTYYKDEPCLAGLLDYCPEEIRKEAYEAIAKNTVPTYTQGLKTLLDKSRQRRMELKNINMHQMQSEIKAAMEQSLNDSSSMGMQSSSQSGSIFGGSSQGLFGQSQSFGGGASIGGGTFGATQNPFGAAANATMQSTQPSSMGTSSSSASSTSLFGPTSQSLFGSSNTTATMSNTALFGTGNTGIVTSPFATTTASNQPGIVQQTTFGSATVSSGQTTTGAAASEVAPSTPCNLKCSEEDIAAFRADHFVLGKIPECPPPPELCS